MRRRLTNSPPPDDLGGRSWRRRRPGLVVVAVVGGALFALFVSTLLSNSLPAFSHDGIGLVTGRVWNPAAAIYGGLPLLLGTLETTAIAMALAIPIGLAGALYLVAFGHGRLRTICSRAIELLASIPSVVYGLWGLQVGAPFVRTVIEPAVHAVFGPLGVANGQANGVGLLLAALLLTVMVLPTFVSVARDVLAAVPSTQFEGALALGASRTAAARRVLLRSSRAGLLGAATLALGRALGETIAIAMVIGNLPRVPGSLFAPADTMTSVIVSEYAEATEPFHAASLVAIALVLLAVSLGVNTFARVLVRGSDATAPRLAMR